VACICRVLWPSDERVVSAAKLIRLASDCGQALSVSNAMLYMNYFYKASLCNVNSPSSMIWIMFLIRFGRGNTTAAIKPCS
jgi:hypothetical protein